MRQETLVEIEGKILKPVRLVMLYALECWSIKEYEKKMKVMENKDDETNMCLIEYCWT